MRASFFNKQTAKRTAIGLVAAGLLQTALPAQAAAPTYKSDYGQFTAASPSTEISPVDAVRDAAGNWFVMDEGLGCIKVYSPDHATVTNTFFTCGTKGADATHISRARGIGLDRRTDDGTPGGGGLWIADTGNHRVVKVDVGTGAVLVNTKVSGATGGALSSPGDVAVDSSGNAYIIDLKNRVVKVRPDGTFISQFGGPTSGFNGINTALSIEFSTVGGDALYLTDTRNYRVDKFSTSGTILRSFGCPLAGPSGAKCIGKGNGMMSKDARGVAVDPAGNVYAADTGGDRIVRWNASGVAGTSLGNGVYGKSGNLDLFYGARGIYSDANTPLAVCDMFNFRVLLWNPANAGTANSIYTGQVSGDLPAVDDHMEPHGVAVDDNGNVYVADYWYQWIQRFSNAGPVITSPGDPGPLPPAGDWGLGRGDDPGTLNFPGGIEVDNAGDRPANPNGFLYIANREERVIDRWVLTGANAGTFNHRFNLPLQNNVKAFPRDVAVNQATGKIYVADEKVAKVHILPADDTAGTTTPAATTIGTYGAPGQTHALSTVQSVAIDQASGNLYVADVLKHIHVYDGNGTWIRTFTVSDRPAGIAVRNGVVYVLSFRISTYNISDTQTSATPTATARFGSFLNPYVGIDVDAAGKIYVGASENHRVEMFSL
jgi:sugar lactone lactonase YvrE